MRLFIIQFIYVCKHDLSKSYTHPGILCMQNRSFWSNKLQRQANCRPKIDDYDVIVVVCGVSACRTACEVCVPIANVSIIPI